MAKTRLTKEQVIKRNKRLRRKIIGGVFVVLALVGVGTLIAAAARGVASMLDDTDDREYYADLFYTVVALDPAPFDITEAPDDQLLLEAAIWATVRGENTDKYTHDANGMLQVPAVDVATYAKRMYGGNYEIKNATFTDVDLEFKYDITTNMYTLPLTSLVDTYYPKIVAITSSGGTKVLSVAYMSTSSETFFGGDTADEQPVKYMEYVLTKQDGEYKLTAVRTPVLSATPSV